MKFEKSSSIVLPDTEILKETARRAALLDAVLMQEWEFRYYSFNSQWSQGEEMGSMRDGSGNEFYILFRGKSCCIKLIDKEMDNTEDILNAAVNLSGADRDVLDDFLSEPAFDPEFISFLVWNVDGKWTQLGRGETELLNIFTDPVSEYRKFALDYYERILSSEVLQKIFAGHFTWDLFIELNPDLDRKILKSDLKEIGVSAV